MRSNDVVFVLANGFCFNNDFWKNFPAILSKDHIYLSDIDTTTYKFEKNKKFIGIGHSLGFIKLLLSGIMFYEFIGINAFTNFCGNCETIRADRIKELNFFKRMFYCDRDATMSNFLKRCGCCDFSCCDFSDADKDFELLYADFELPFSIKTTIVASSLDTIVPKRVVLDNFSGAKNVEIIFVESDKHVVPNLDAAIKRLSIS